MSSLSDEKARLEAELAELKERQEVDRLKAQIREAKRKDSVLGRIRKNLIGE